MVAYADGGSWKRSCSASDCSEDSGTAAGAAANSVATPEAASAGAPSPLEKFSDAAAMATPGEPAQGHVHFVITLAEPQDHLRRDLHFQPFKFCSCCRHWR